MKWERKRRPAGSLHAVTSMVDVVLLLLMYWVSTTTFEAKEAATEVILPPYLPQPFQMASDKPELPVVHIDAQGAMRVAGDAQVLNQAELNQWLQRQQKTLGEQAVLVVRCDKRASYDAPHRLLTLATQAGFQNFDLKSAEGP